MNWKPTRGYVAVQPLGQNTGPVRVGNVFLASNLVKATLHGRVLAIGPGVRDLTVGDTVAYERQSAHPGQDRPIPATYFGGDEGQFAVILPAGKYAEDVSHIDSELLARQAELDEILKAWRNKPHIPEDVQWQAGKHKYEIDRLNAKKRRGSRTKAFTRSDQAGNVVNQGIIAVLAEETQDGQ